MQLVVSYLAGGEPWTEALTGIATGVLAIAALFGLVAANNRVRRAAAEIDADVFAYDQGVGLRIRVVVRSVGFGRLRFGTGGRAPTVLVREFLVDAAGRQSDGRAWKTAVFDGKTIDPAEAASAVIPFLLPTPPPGLVGWDLDFEFWLDHRQSPFSSKQWWWTATGFVPLPQELRDATMKTAAAMSASSLVNEGVGADGG